MSVGPAQPVPEHSGADAFRILVEALTLACQVQLQDLMEQDDPQSVHKARVTLRRFRAAVAANAPIIDEDLAAAMQYRARNLFRVLGEVRDADVMAARFAGTDRSEELASDALASRQKTRKRLKKIKAEKFGAWVFKRLKSKRWHRAGKKAKALREGAVSSLAAQALNGAWKVAVSNGADLTAMSPRAQHELRKDLKTLRYLSEFFVDIWPKAPHETFLATLRDLQDDLGEVTDLELARTMGHAKGEGTPTEAQRAAQHWTTLRSAGPWWGDPLTA